MSDRDYYTDTLRRREKALEDRYFAERDRELAERLRRRRESPPAGDADRPPAEQDGQTPA